MLGWILTATIGVALLVRFGYIGQKKIVEVQGHYLQHTCSPNNIDMQVTASTQMPTLLGTNIAPEVLNFEQGHLAQFVKQKTAPYLAGEVITLADFTLVGYMRSKSERHCSGAQCFVVQKIKFAGDSTFIEF